MSNEPSEGDIKKLWQNQVTESLPMPLEELQRKAKMFRSRIRRRNIREYVAAAILIVWVGSGLLRFSTPLNRAGQITIIAGVVYVVWQLRRRASTAILPVEASASNWLDFHRRQLERQRDALRSVWKWYLAPLIPGIALLLAGLSRTIEQRTGSIALIPAVAAANIVVFGAVWCLNVRAARRLQRRIDELDALQKD
jgi:hypothetical protein